MGFISVLKKIGEVGAVAAPLAATFAPGGSAATALPAIIAAIAKSAASTAAVIEISRGPGQGEQKMEAASAAMRAVIPVLVQSIELSIGRDCVDEELLTRAALKYLDASVDIMNAIKLPVVEITG